MVATKLKVGKELTGRLIFIWANVQGIVDGVTVEPPFLLVDHIARQLADAFTQHFQARVVGDLRKVVCALTVTADAEEIAQPFESHLTLPVIF